MSNSAYGVTRQDVDTGLCNKESSNGASSAVPIALKENDAYVCEKPIATTSNESYNYPYKYDPSNSVEMIQNDAYALEEPVTLSNTIEAKQNEAYVMSITTEKNEAYKPVTADNHSVMISMTTFAMI